MALLPAEQEFKQSGEKEGEKMDVDEGAKRPQAGVPVCDVEGCAERRKYRLVKDWARGACGMAHLKVLEQAAVASA